MLSSNNNTENSAIQDLFDSEIDELAERLGGIIKNRESRGVSTIVLDLSQFRTFKNIIHFTTDPEGLGLQTLWEYTRQYQYIRDFYSLLCPKCNEPGPNPQMPYDCWGRSPQQLQEETLFEDVGNGIYVCPKCQIKQDDIPHPKYNTLLGMCGMRSLSGDSLILTQDGLVRLDQKPKTIWNRNGIQKVTQFISEGIKPTYKITTQFGFSVKCSPIHPFLTAQGKNKHFPIPKKQNPLMPLCECGCGWRIIKKNRKFIHGHGCVKPDNFIECQNLTTKNRLILPLNQNLFGTKKHNPNLSFFTGLLIGDGCITGRKPFNYVFKISGSCDETLTWLKQFHKGSSFEYPNKWSYEFSDVKLADKFASMGYNKGWKAPTKEIPKLILESDKETVIQFLRGLFEADGCVSTDCLNLTTVSPVLAKQVHLLLLNLGIVASNSNSPTRKYNSKELTGNTSYTLKIKGYQWLQKFYSTIGFFSSKKQKKLQKLIDSPRLPTEKYKIQKAGWGEYIKVKIRKIEKVEDQELYDIHVPVGNSFVANGLVSHNSGKSVLAAIILLYELHKLLLMENPQKTWGLIPGQEIYATCCTTKVEQSKDTIFAAVDGIFENSPWYTKYNQALKNHAIALGIPLDKVFVKNLEEIRYLHKQIFVDNTGANSAGIAGKTRYIAVIDEIARFMQTDSRLGVDMVYDTLSASLLTLSKFGSKMICISSPIVKGDKITRLIEEAKEKKPPNVLWFVHSTWDFNPHLPLDDPYIQNKFSENPVAAKRDFGADPPGAQNPWMEEDWRIDGCVDDKIPALFHTKNTTSSLIVKDVRTDMIGKEIMWKDIETTKHIVIACDPGQRKDAFGMIVAYLKPIRTVRGIEEHMFIGAAEAWIPTQKPRREVDFANVLKTIKELSEWWLLDKVVYDQWSSAPHIQDLMMAGIDAEKIPLKKEDWDSLYALLYNKQVHLLHPKIGGDGAKQLIWELKNLELKENGKVDHSSTTSSDIAVCLARAAKVLMGEDRTAKRVAEARASHIGQIVSFKRP